MATKAKAKSKVIKKAAKRASAGGKSVRLKVKRAARAAKRPAKVETRRTSVASAVSGNRSTSPPRVRSKHFASAVQAYEAGIKLMHNEEFGRAIKCFAELISEHSDEPEIQERAKVLIHASEKKLQEK